MCSWGEHVCGCWVVCSVCVCYMSLVAMLLRSSASLLISRLAVLSAAVSDTEVSQLLSENCVFSSFVNSALYVLMVSQWVCNCLQLYLLAVKTVLVTYIVIFVSCKLADS